MSDIERILSALSIIRIPAQPEEYEIHAEVARALDMYNIEYIHECKLGPRRRIDFLCGSVGIEIKKGRPEADRLREQASRYLESERLSALVVVAQRPCALPGSLHGKALREVALDRLWGVALP